MSTTSQAYQQAFKVDSPNFLLQKRLWKVLEALLAPGSELWMFNEGALLFWLKAMIRQLSPTCDQIAKSCSSPTTTQLAFLYVSYGLMAIGTDGVKASSLAFGMDQLCRKEKDAAIIESYFNWSYASGLVAVLFGITILVYLQENLGWKVGFGVLLVLIIGMIVSVVVDVVVGIGVLLALLLYVKIRQRKRMVRAVEGSLVAFRYQDLQNATMNFSEKLGEGGFGSVFKGTLGDTSVVAVKKLESTSHVEKHFQMETTKLGKVQHANLVRLRGFCSEEETIVALPEAKCVYGVTQAQIDGCQRTLGNSEYRREGNRSHYEKGTFFRKHNQDMA
ncbi:Protein NRT1/ PTR FAMILY 1.2 [Glycine soja]|uniref:Protein NRT1/ PTR FAMILY 1.2 n=1 Tax=Glycine soja TaxID=3848 RepID=A0A445L110_GLYSO|nr:Protein NRT1/ PTR FAMILY 1.2 [Glycine soja]